MLNRKEIYRNIPCSALNKMSRFTFPLSLILALFFFAPSDTLCADPPIRSEYYAKVWGIEHGLSQGTIPCMMQTPDGYIWLGTQESLSRFDGVRFVNFTSKNTPVLKSSWIQSMALSRANNLLLGTWRGGIYELIDGSFHPLHHEPHPVFDQAIIYALVAAEDGSIWAGTSEGLFSLRGGQIQRHTPEKGPPIETIRCLALARDGSLWIGTQDQGLWIFRDKRFQPVINTDCHPGSMVWAMAPAGPDSLWIGCGHTLLHHDGQAFTAHPVPVRQATNQITCITQAQDGTVWLGMQNEGAWRFNRGVFTSVNAQDGLGSGLTQSVMEDREHNIWVGTNGTGVTQFVQNKIRVISREEGLSVKDIWTVMEADDGSLWIGTHGGGLNRYLNGQITAFTMKDGLSSQHVTALHQSPRDGSLWIGTEDNGINHIRDDKITRYRLGSSLSENIIYAIHEQADGMMLIGTAAGIAFFRDGLVVKRLTTQDGLTNNAVRELVPTRQTGELWVSADIGLNLIRDGRLVATYGKKEGLIEEALNGLYLDGDDHLWIGTYGGGIVHHHAGRFTIIGSESGLHNDVIYDIIEDDHGRLWMGSNRGIFAVIKADLLDFIAGRRSRITCIPLGIGDGLKALECNGGRQPSAWLTRSGLACFATMNGVAMLDTHGFKLDEPAPDVLFEQVRINNHPQPLAEHLSISPGKRNLDIDFTVPFFSAPEKIRIRYRLVPFEDEWQENQGIRQAHYTNIPQGQYRFELESSNRYGLWNKGGKPSTLSLHFRPFFYETWLYKILGLLLLLAFIAYLIHRRTRQLQKSKRLLETAVETRTRELKEAYAKMERLSLTDTLTCLFNRRYFHNIIDREVSMVIRQYNRPTAPEVSFAMGFLMIDIDHFKLINDQYGHLCGDHFLQMISKRFLETLRNSDLIVRWGGEEFLVLSKENDFEGARLLCRRLLAAINQTPFLLDDHAINGSISIGFCPFPVMSHNPDLFTWEDTVNLADQALYRAKHSGRNCAVGIRMHPELLDPEKIAIIREDFSRALEEKLIELVYEQS
jgi:diguanylate cyclase (GGDEF)-like protein